MVRSKVKSEEKHEHPPEHTFGWYFYEFWPIMLFGGLFVIMCAIPISLSGLFAASDVYSSSDQVWAPWGLFIIGAFLVCLTLMFVLPRLVGWAVFLIGVAWLVLAEGATAMNWGPWMAILFLFFMLVGNVALPQKKEAPVESDD